MYRYICVHEHYRYRTMTLRRHLSHRTFAITSRYCAKASSPHRSRPAPVLCSRRSFSLSSFLALVRLVRPLLYDKRRTQRPRAPSPPQPKRFSPPAILHSFYPPPTSGYNLFRVAITRARTHARPTRKVFYFNKILYRCARSSRDIIILLYVMTACTPIKYNIYIYILTARIP